MNRISHVGGDSDGEDEDAPKRKKVRNSKKEISRRKLMAASAEIKSLMAVEPTKKQVAEFIAHKIEELNEEV